MAEERDPTVEEKPSTYNRKGQKAGIWIAVLVLVVLVLSSLGKFFGGGTKIAQETTDRAPMVARSSPDQEREKFEKRFERAEISIDKKLSTGRPAGDVIRNLREKRDALHNPPEVSAVSEVDEWKKKELDLVRSSRYDDYSLDLGFNSKGLDSAVAAPGATSLAPKNGSKVSDAIANVTREIERVNRFRAQLETEGAGSLPAVGTPSSPAAPLEVGHSMSVLPQNMPLPGQKLLPVTTVIRAALDQKVISDYVGPYRGRILEDVYDVSNRYILIPKGSTIDGRSLRISNVNEPIQARMALTVNYVVLPNGHKINFQRQFALDREGVSAIKDKGHF